MMLHGHRVPLSASDAMTFLASAQASASDLARPAAMHLALCG